MAVGAFKLFWHGKKNISLTSGIVLGTTTLQAHFFKSAGASQPALYALSTLGSVKTYCTEVASANNYTTAGKAVTGNYWSVQASGTVKFTVAAFVQTATGGNVTSLKLLAIVAQTGASAKAATNKVLCFSTLSTASFQISQNNTLTITPNTAGVFYLV